MQVKFVKATDWKDPVYGKQRVFSIKISNKKVGEIMEFTSPISLQNDFQWVVYDKTGKPVYHGLLLDECKYYVEKYPNRFIHEE
jgi:hypothetical protein